MKVLYSQLKELVPGLKASPKAVGDKFSLAGLMMDGLEKVVFKGKPDWLISLEVRQNRPDCLGVIGLAREVAAYYGLKLKLPQGEARFPAGPKPRIAVKAPKLVKRALAATIEGVKNGPSPSWLKEYLAFYDINSINLLVDLSNYVMFFTGYPSHLLDTDKMKGGLVWAPNLKFKNLVTLDGTQVQLRGKEVVLQDDVNILGLAGIVGGQKAAIALKTKNIIAEMAVYDRVSVRRDSRALKVKTEASTRLEKELDPEGLDYAFNLLVSLILKESGGQLAASYFSYYPVKRISPKIRFNPSSPSLFSGVKIPESQAENILKRLGFALVKKNIKNWLVAPAVSRTDVALAEDLVEEITRVFGFEKIPANELPAFEFTQDITPKSIVLAEKTRDILSSLGFDEILSWPLTKKELNGLTNWRDWENISTQNSVNEEFPDLRQSIAPNLMAQLEEYGKTNVDKVAIFEIGRVFGQKSGKFLENDSLGLLFSDDEGLAKMKTTVETLLRLLGLAEITYSTSKKTPELANPFASWNIEIGGNSCGIIYQTKKGDAALAEINLSAVVGLLAKTNLNPVVELEQKLVVLDTNVETEKPEEIQELMEKIKSKIGEDNLWSLEISDSFPLAKSRTRYTIRVSYKNLTDQEAKQKHLKIFKTESQ